jgi:hypothetical protein
LIANQDSMFLNILHLKVESLFLHLSLCTHNKALGLLNPNLLKFLGYHNWFRGYLQKGVDFFNSVLYSAQTFDFLQLFHIPLAIQLDPNEIELFSFFAPES